MENLIGVFIQITGIVQGVGFRPFVYEYARKYNLSGWVRNTSAGVDIQVEGTSLNINNFMDAITNRLPPLAMVIDMTTIPVRTENFDDFVIIRSQPIKDAFQPISPDTSICKDCIKELNDPKDRRYKYPFINCTNCGPRYTIIEDIPYDRPFTTMAPFEMCDECQSEYNNPKDRRFHAQPIACPNCGPHIWLEYSTKSGGIKSTGKTEVILKETLSLLNQGKIIAVKGLGGFHFACDAMNYEAVEKLRIRKLRVEKPFAVMMRDLETVNKHCYLNEFERTLLGTQQKPIVILNLRCSSTLASNISPNQKTAGVMLPYTPLHHLLFNDREFAVGNKLQPSVLVMTSANLSDEPITIDNREAKEHLDTIADAFLMHDRSIKTRCDDSVFRVFLDSSQTTKSSSHGFSGEHASSDRKVLNDQNSFSYPVRRSRGYTPFPLIMSQDTPSILAVGAELKNTFCITRDGLAFVSHHIGDLENYDTLRSFTESITHYEKLFRISPKYIAHDFHPDYLSTRYAKKRTELDHLPLIGVQHHHAHMASCMAENKISGDNPTIGIIFDGSGYGLDGNIWGGEVLLSINNEFKHIAQLKYTALPGGDLAIKNPYRTAIAYLWQEKIDYLSDLPCFNDLSSDEYQIITSQLEKGINSPLTSSIGRLFDAVASICGVRNSVNYEAQAAIELETIADKTVQSSYNLKLEKLSEIIRIDPSPLINAVVEDVINQIDRSIISARFHNALVETILKLCHQIRETHHCSDVVLSGGVWQNMFLLEKTVKILKNNHFDVFIHHHLPPNDGCISFGQAIISANKWKSGKDLENK